LTTTEVVAKDKQKDVLKLKRLKTKRNLKLESEQKRKKRYENKTVAEVSIIIMKLLMKKKV